ncbi:FAD-binding dehydrogenase [Pedococcus sp. NPDC057267]|uniref:FAD-binding dehydrogenase n=1 Tax=Pedococcus sp. NPDC057267 TaxID=3346077 RepID=UPI00362DA834
MDADVIVVGAGLAGLVATAELADAGRRVLVVDQESAANLGGQAFWSFGGLLFADSPEQRRMGVKDSAELLWQDWQGSAGFDRLEDEDRWPVQWARAYCDFAGGEKRSWLHQQGMRWFPVVGWAERGDGSASGHGNSVPRFHITWGTGPGVLEPFLRRVGEHVATGRVELRHRHQVDELVTEGGAVTGVRGTLLAVDPAERGRPTNRDAVGEFELTAQAVVVTSGGIGANHDLVRANWPERLGTPPERMITGVPAYVDGRMLAIAERAGGRLVNRDRMWHYVEGISNWDPIWPAHAIRILPGPSSMWFDGNGDRLPAPFFPGFDTLGTLAHLRQTGHDHSWFVLTTRILGKEFALSGSEQNPDLTGKSVKGVLGRARTDIPAPVKAFLERGADFVSADTLRELVEKMNRLTPDAPLDLAHVERQVRDRDAQVENAFSKDAQVTAIRGARNYRGDKLIRTAAPHRILDPEAGPLVAVRLNVLTRKTLGGLETDLSARVLSASGEPVPGLYAAGEVAGFGGGGVHGYRSLEGTFLGGCIFSGRTAGRAAAAEVG